MTVGAMDHRDSYGMCIWCHGAWPCDTAKIRHELAGFLRRTDGAPNETDGIDKAADLIDISNEEQS